MILVGLTGGIGSGKSTVSQLLSERGAIIVDADAVARELQQPGTEVLRLMAEAFGQEICNADGSLNRQAVADRVFGNAEALKILNGIVHPAIGKEMNRRIEEQRSTNNVVVLDIPLLVENPREGLCGVIVVDVPVDIAVDRLVSARGMAKEDAEARVSRQASREDRRAIADKVIDNSRDLEFLRQQVDEVWAWMQTLPAAAPDAGKQVRPEVKK
ncbi:MAG: dephospho-CoA kinase [Actinomycetota bacterium]|jgi:dephospho-CoA kinase